jgi:hypothetical protein
MKRLFLLILATFISLAAGQAADNPPAGGGDSGQADLQKSNKDKNNKAATSPTERKQAGVVVFNNTLNYLGRYFYTSNEFGDQIQLSTQVTNRLFLRFQLEYYLSDNASGDETIQIRFYNNDGTNNAPQKMLYEMANPVKLAKGFNSVVIEGLPLQMPDIFTWTVEFKGITDNEQAGLLFYHPPSIGVAYEDYWEKENDVWVSRKVAGVPANFGMLVLAISAAAPPPELPLPRLAQPTDIPIVYGSP